jgi:hypothetical protein
VGWIYGPRLPQQPTTGIYYGTPGFKVLGCPYSPTFQSAQSLDCGICCHVPSPNQRSRLTPASGSSRLNATATQFLQEYQVSRPWDLAPHVPCDQWSRYTLAFRSPLTSTAYTLNPLECQVSGIRDLLPCVPPQSTVRIYSTLQSFGSLQTLTILDQV